MRAEKEYELKKLLLEFILEHHVHLHMITKSDLVTRDFVNNAEKAFLKKLAEQKKKN